MLTIKILITLIGMRNAFEHIYKYSFASMSGVFKMFINYYSTLLLFYFSRI